MLLSPAQKAPRLSQARVFYSLFPFFTPMKSIAPISQSPRRRSFRAVHFICFVAFFGALALFSACSEERQTPTDVLITVNDFTLSRNQFNEMLKFEAEVNPAFRLSKEGSGIFLRQLIEKQLLIQEAHARKLDEQEMFRQAIERYWESTLIRDLLYSQGEEIRRGTVVTEEEIAAWRQVHKDSLPDLPLADQRDGIRRAVENEKVDEAMRHWLDGLRAKARVTISDPELRKEANIDHHDHTGSDTLHEVK